MMITGPFYLFINILPGTVFGGVTFGCYNFGFYYHNVPVDDNGSRLPKGGHSVLRQNKLIVRKSQALFDKLSFSAGITKPVFGIKNRTR